MLLRQAQPAVSYEQQYRQRRCFCHAHTPIMTYHKSDAADFFATAFAAEGERGTAYYCRKHARHLRPCRTVKQQTPDSSGSCCTRACTSTC
mmetsp:Transcript_22737/g.43590  ORF Transcript_22737/g.43590 Transcript_22737/m.43590 type:complete len:91 (-) Transcript_22737:1322-1594(-)